MKQRIFASIVLAMLTLLASCEKETVLNIDQTTLSFTDVGGSQTISLTANKPWTASSNQSWCKMSPSAGEDAASSRITITCDDNTTYDSRNCSVTFTCAEKTVTVNVSQATNNGLLVSQSSYELTKSAQQLNIQVQANVKFSVEIDNGCKDWVKFNTTKGLTTTTFVLDISENKTYDSREGKVTIKQDGGSLSSTITIKQSQLDGLFITTPEYNLSNESHTLTVEVSTNVEFDVFPEAEWVKFVQTKGLNTKQIILEVAENDTYDQRETKVSVKQKNGVLCGTITIKQDEKHGIMVTQSEYSLSNEAQTIEVEIKYNVDYNVVIPEDCKNWIKLVSTKSLDSKTYMFSVAKNETYDNRDGSITFKQKSGPLSGTVEIRQSQTDGIVADKNEYLITAESQVIDIPVRSNINYDVIIDETCKGWISMIRTKGLVEETLSFQIAHNENEQRKGKIYLKSSTIEEEIVVLQEAEGFVEFDDENFEAFCLKYYDKNEDGRISYSEAARVESISYKGNSIKSLRGIEHFYNINYLWCPNNQLSSLDVSNNTALSGLDCSNNKLTSLDVSHNTALNSLDCGGNLLTSLDVSKNTALNELVCDKNQLTYLDVSNNIALTNLVCDNNQLTNLDVRNCKALYQLSCYHNLLSSLDISNNTALYYLWCDENHLTSLNVNNCTALEGLFCYHNLLTSLDVSNNTALNELVCDKNQLTYLDVSNNIALTMLVCESNQLTNLDVRNCTAIRQLYCSSNLLTSLDISKCIAIKQLSCDSNLLTSLDVGNCTALKELSCGDNLLTNLDVSNNIALTYLWCGENQLTSLDVRNCTVLKQLSCGGNSLSSLDVRNNTVLFELYCGGNLLTSLDISENLLLTRLWCIGNPYLTVIWLKTNQTINDFHYDMDVATIKYK